MKTCAPCGTKSDQDTCPNCGESSWTTAPSDAEVDRVAAAAPKPDRKRRS